MYNNIISLLSNIFAREIKEKSTDSAVVSKGALFEIPHQKHHTTFATDSQTLENSSNWCIDRYGYEAVFLFRSGDVGACPVTQSA